MLAAVDWQGIATVIAALGAACAAVLGALNRNSIKVPSGGTIGSKVELTHDLAAVATLSTAAAMSQKDATEPPSVSAGPGLDRAVERLNDAADGSVKVNGEAYHS